MRLEQQPGMPFRHNPREMIRNAAVLYKGEQFEGVTHGHALSALLEHLKIKEPEFYAKVGGDEYRLVEELEKMDKSSTDFEGFVTTTGRYVSRKEASTIARDAGQLNKRKDEGSELYSEDLKG